MADVVTTTTLQNNPKHLTVHLTSKSDGTGESAVAKVDKSTFTGPNGLEPTDFVLEEVHYDVSSMRVELYLDRTTAQTLVILQGQGHLDFKAEGGLLKASTGLTGDVLLTTTNHSSGDGYDITIKLRKKD